jgi:hypothetical protein
VVRGLWRRNLYNLWCCYQRQHWRIVGGVNYQGGTVFNFAVIHNTNGGVCDRFASEKEAREAYPDKQTFSIEHYTDQETAEIDALCAD